MENNFYEKLSLFLKENNIDSMPSNNKEILKELKTIAYIIKVNEDLTDFMHEQKKDNLTTEEYLDKLEKLDNNMNNTIYYTTYIRALIKKERKQQFVNFFKKIPKRLIKVIK